MNVTNRKSLKRDRYSYVKDDNTYWYANGSGIDCFHRLRLTKKSLELLLKIGKFERRAEMPRFPEECASECSTKACELWENFRKQFNNPYNLDVEYVPSDNIPHYIKFCFYDYDYCYYLEWHVEACLESCNQGAWSIVCTKSFYEDLNESEVELDMP